MIKSNVFEETAVRKVVGSQGAFSVVEYLKDYSVNPALASTAYFASKMNIHKKQVVANLVNSGIILQAGAMQMVLGDVNVATNVKGAGDFAKKLIGGKVTGESAVKPLYQGTGSVVLEPTYKYIILSDLQKWNGAVVLEDGAFLACESTVNLGVTSRKSISSAIAGGEGLFNTRLSGSGVFVLESPVPQEELMVIDLENDVLKIDGSMAIAWSDNLEFTVEKTTKTLVGSAASGEGLVNVYRGTGRVIVAPVAGPAIPAVAVSSNSSKSGAIGSFVGGLLSNM